MRELPVRGSFMPTCKMNKTISKRQSIVLILGILVALICLSALKGLYVNLHNAYSDVYNPLPDLLISVFGGVLLGLILGYWFKIKR